MNAWKSRSWVLLLACYVTAASAVAEVVRIEVRERGDVASGRAYGDAGAYEKLRGTLHFAVDPQAAANARVTDIALAPTDAAGRVTFTADFYLLKPKNGQRGNGALLFEVSNRGRKGILPMLSHAAPSIDPTTAAEVGDGFLLEQGFTLLWVGWQLDPPSDDGNLLRVYPPAATAAAAPVHGLVRSDFIVRTTGIRHQSLGDGEHVAYPVTDPTSASNTLTVRDAPAVERRTIPRDEWRFARVADDGTVVPDTTHVYLDGGFEPRKIYEVVYTAVAPPLAGLGLVAIRDSVTRLKHDGASELGIAPGTLDRALAFGISQSGRVLRTFLYDGFNEDERERRVFDGVLAHIAGGARGGFNVRFAQPSRSSSSHFYPNELFPFSDAAQTDPVTGETDGLLARVAPGARPKIFYTNSSNEYWRGSAALTHVTLDGRRDLPPEADTRIYLFAGTQHAPASFPPSVGAGRLPGNPNDYSWFLRALLLRLDAWVADAEAPPPSRYPTLLAGTLVERAKLAFPTVPGVVVPATPRAVHRLDFGPHFRRTGIATIEPPTLGAAFPLLLPQVDEDGNERDGLRSPELAVPLATYTGWNLYDPSLGRDDELVSLQGGCVPLPVDAAARARSRDPRRAILERYTDRADYLELVEASAALLVADRYLRAEDVPLIVHQAGERWRALVEERGSP